MLLSMAPLWFSSCVLELRVPTVSSTVENIADFVSAYVIGNLLQIAFRFWAFRRWVFPDEFGRDPDKAIESALTDGGIAEAIEDGRDPNLGGSTVTPLRRPPRRTKADRSAGRRTSAAG